jgi:hypothetical protein
MVNGLLRLEVTDNGVGREIAAATPGRKIKGRSVSTMLTEKRLMYFRKVLREKSIRYEIIDLYKENEPAGTKVIIKLPYKKIFA